MNFKEMMNDIKFTREFLKDDFHTLTQKVFIAEKILEKLEMKMSVINSMFTLVWNDCDLILPEYDFDCIVKWDEFQIFVAQYNNGEWILNGQIFPTHEKPKFWAKFPDTTEKGY